ncbi:MAG: hypothetical protein OER91_09565 [Gammaproteobacteria bacterium]|nr:hypothetical protein [Gammaproteobacteria bacterium]
MKKRESISQILALIVVGATLSACAGVPQVTRVPVESEPVDAPYEKLLVIGLFDSFDARKYFEKEAVSALEAKGVEAIAFTSLVDLREPVNRDTVIPVVEQIGVDAVLVTQLSDLQTTSEVKTRNPQATRNFRPTYYYNVFSVELTEYVEPPAVQYSFDLALRADLVSVNSKTPVWAVNLDTEDELALDTNRNYSIYIDQAAAIVNALEQDQLIGR